MRLAPQEREGSTISFPSYEPNDHYWVVGGDESRFWSSRSSAYVLPTDTAYVAWVKQGNAASRIANEFELDQVLRQHGMTTGKWFSAAETLDALTQIDAGQVKTALGRDDIRSTTLVSGDAEKLADLAFSLQPSTPGEEKPAPPKITGVSKAFTTAERLEALER